MGSIESEIINKINKNVYIHAHIVQQVTVYKIDNVTMYIHCV